MSRRRAMAGRREGGRAPLQVPEGAPQDSDARPDEFRGGRRKRLALLAAAVALPLVVVSALFVFVLDGESGPPRAAIVDQLSLTFPNPDFAEQATDILEEAGYAVDYYPGEEVTVELYRRLPTRGYDMVVLRTHAGRFEVDGELTQDAPLFTSEPYTGIGYYKEQQERRVVRAWDGQGNPPTFGIAASFIESSMKGDFDGATVLLMGCDVLRSESLAEAFVKRGAATVVGWDDSVTAGHTDAATERLLEHLVGEGLSTDEAVARTMAEVGPDPAYGATLRVYPPEG